MPKEFCQGHPVCLHMCVSERVSEYVNKHEIVYAQGIVLIVIKVNVCVCLSVWGEPWSLYLIC